MAYPADGMAPVFYFTKTDMIKFYACFFYLLLLLCIRFFQLFADKFFARWM